MVNSTVRVTKLFPLWLPFVGTAFFIDFVQQPGLFLEQPLKTFTCTDWPLTDVFVSKNGNLLIYLINDLCGSFKEGATTFKQTSFTYPMDLCLNFSNEPSFWTVISRKLFLDMNSFL